MLCWRLKEVNELLAVLERVKARIQEHRKILQTSEALTRYVLIDPVLRCLGWDTADPTQVFPEFPTETGGRPDYALLIEGKPHIMVEAKSLGTDLEKALDKGFQYCWRSQVPFYVVTDGNLWVVFDITEMGGKEVAQVCLTDTSVGEAARVLLALWRPTMPKVEPLNVIVASEFGKGAAPQPKKANRKTLVEVKKLASQNLRPSRIHFPDGVTRNVETWRDILLCTVDWLKRDLKKAVPVPVGPRSTRPLVALDEKGMRSPRLVAPFYVETHFSAKGIVSRTVWLLQQVNQDPRKITLEF